jgi:hypothetical protein
MALQNASSRRLPQSRSQFTLTGKLSKRRRQRAMIARRDQYAVNSVVNHFHNLPDSTSNHRQARGHVFE